MISLKQMILHGNTGGVRTLNSWTKKEQMNRINLQSFYSTAFFNFILESHSVLSRISPSAGYPGHGSRRENQFCAHGQKEKTTTYQLRTHSHPSGGDYPPDFFSIKFLIVLLKC